MKRITLIIAALAIIGLAKAQSPNLFSRNRSNFAEQLPPKSVALFTANEAMPRNGDEFFPFRQQSDFYYLTGINEENAFLIIAPNYPDEKYREILFIEPYDEAKAIYQGEMLDANNASKISGIKTIKSSNDFFATLNDMVFSGYCETIFLNTYEYPKYECGVETIQKRFNKQIKECYPMHQYGRSAPILNALRLVKSEEEIELTRQACDITSEAFLHCLRTVRPGLYEYQMQAELEYIFKYNNANGNAFAPIVAAGKNGCSLHYSKNQGRLNEGELILFDIGCEYKNYSSDLSRTIPINGKFTPRQRECYEAVLRVMKEVEKLYVPGNTINDINEATLQLMEKEMIGLGLFTAGEVKSQNSSHALVRKYLPHGVAHHIGLDTHDNLDKFIPFEPGMILTLEPGIYIPEENIGIRIENDLLITNGKPVNLFKNLPVEVEDIEAAMKKK
ncbi:MAG: aminopeptidase P N-terminal domain-containing protein [Bacteroidales bacterium]|nr:aminopeptidase P N-terminal domain-containing protein [Bacteroidales bacterium]